MSESLVILLVGPGAREHALALTLASSPLVTTLYLSPGNPGTANAHPKITNIDILYDLNNLSPLLHFALIHNVNLVLPGPEQPLVDGIQSSFRKIGIPTFGPSQKAAHIEGSKSFAKAFMQRNSLPTSPYRSFRSSDEILSAQSYVSELFASGLHEKVVIKASGLAAGKGVVICDNVADATNVLEDMLVRNVFGDAGSEIIIEHYLTGPEVSLLAFSDGYTILPLPPAQDHKRVGDGDTGLNTGGMGAYAPLPAHIAPGVVVQELEAIVQRTVDAMRKEGFPFTGLLFTGFILSPTGPKILEYNVRFGDPETEALLPLLDTTKSDLAEIILACIEHRLDYQTLSLKPGSAVSLVLASKGYPGPYEKGKIVTIKEELIPKDVQIFHAGTSLSPDSPAEILTSGGRVLVISAYAPTLREALDLAYQTVQSGCVFFEGMFCRGDLGFRAFQPTPQRQLTYASAGVSIPAGNLLVERIKPLIKSTARPGSDASIGGFGGVFDLRGAGYDGDGGSENGNTKEDDTLLVSGTDGVGTKLKIAGLVGKHDSVGIDLVAMCVNDLLVQGAEPLFFLDYFACGTLRVDIAADVVKGIVDGCKMAGCALVGGETAEMPGMYSGNDYDIAGFAVGAVKRSDLLPKIDEIEEGDILLGIPSSGIHSNGFSLVRKIVELSGVGYSDPTPFPSSSSSPSSSNNRKTLGETLLTPTKIYTAQVLALLRDPHRSKSVKALAHITGGGFIENIPRILPPHLGCVIRCSAYPLPEVFGWIMRVGGVELREMARTFNLGVGMVVIVKKASVEGGLFDELVKSGEMCVLGEVVGEAGVRLVDVDAWDV